MSNCHAVFTSAPQSFIHKRTEQPMVSSKLTQLAVRERGNEGERWRQRRRRWRWWWPFPVLQSWSLQCTPSFPWDVRLESNWIPSTVSEKGRRKKRLWVCESPLIFLSIPPPPTPSPITPTPPPASPSPILAGQPHAVLAEESEVTEVERGGHQG